MPPGIIITATATKMLQRKVAGLLGMHNPTVITVSPCKKKRVSYSSITKNFQPLLTILMKAMPRIIVYCRKYAYFFFRDGLGREFTEPIGSPDLSRFRLVDMFTSVTDAEVKSQIISSFCDP